MNLSIASDVSSRLPSLNVGLLSMRGLTVRRSDETLWREVERASREMAARCGVNAIAADVRIAAVRRMFRALGVDPTRYRASSEALVRRVAQGRSLYQVNTAVDVNNWGSLEERLPFGIYDADRLAGDVVLRLGRAGEAYEAIGKTSVSLEGKMQLCDAAGAFGSPVADSTRTMVSEATRTICLVVFAPDVARDDLGAILKTTAERMLRYNGGTVERTEVIP